MSILTFGTWSPFKPQELFEIIIKIIYINNKMWSYILHIPAEFHLVIWINNNLYIIVYSCLFVYCLYNNINIGIYRLPYMQTKGFALTPSGFCRSCCCAVPASGVEAVSSSSTTESLPAFPSGRCTEMRNLWWHQHHHSPLKRARGIS